MCPFPSPTLDGTGGPRGSAGWAFRLMRVLFYYRCFESAGIEYLCGALEAAGHETGLLFEPGFDDTTYFKLPAAAILNRRGRLLKQAEGFEPDLLAFSMPTNYFPHVSSMAALLKSRIDAPTVAGGPHPSCAPDTVLADPSIDMICLGEGEETVVELAAALQAGRDPGEVPGILTGTGGTGGTGGNQARIRPPVQDLDSLPFPQRRHFCECGVFRGSLLLITSRGCPFNCSYCINNFYRTSLYRDSGYRLRRRSPGNVLAEIERETTRYPVTYIYFNDDDFTSSSSWLREFLPGYASGFGIPFFCFGNPLALDDEKVSGLAAAGCTQIFMGIDSGSESVRRLMNRPMSEERILAAARVVKRYGIKLHTTAIFGTPGEDKDEMWQTVDLLDRVAPDVLSTYLMYPYPGTEIAKKARENGLLDDAAWERILAGKGSLHTSGAFRHPHSGLATRLTNLLPAFIAAPALLKPFVRFFMRRNTGPRLTGLLYVLLLPLTFPLFGAKELRTRLRLLLKSLS